MGNCAGQFSGGGVEGNSGPLASTSVSAVDSRASSSHMALAAQRKPEYFFSRAEEMMRTRNQFPSDVEHAIEHSKVHWSEVPGLEEYQEEVDRENEEVFAELMSDPQWRPKGERFFSKADASNLKLGRKIAEGGQATIFEVIWCHGIELEDCVLKVFKRGTRLSDLRKQWPQGPRLLEVAPVTVRGLMLEDGRFAFLLVKCWGDLRKMIDEAMQEKNNQGPPFPYEWNGFLWRGELIIRGIAKNMSRLHKEGIIHQDLKAANLLIFIIGDRALPIVADFECALGVVGTSFWRAPEVLLALKERSAVDFSEATDVYSFGMTCFEIVTGHLPFEGELETCRDSFDLIIEGRRPTTAS